MTLMTLHSYHCVTKKIVCRKRENELSCFEIVCEVCRNRMKAFVVFRMKYKSLNAHCQVL